MSKNKNKKEEFMLTPKGLIGERWGTLVGEVYMHCLQRHKQPFGSYPAIVFDGEGGEFVWVVKATDPDSDPDPDFDK